MEDTEEETFEATGVDDIAAGGQRRQQLIASCRKDTGTHREECG